MPTPIRIFIKIAQEWGGVDPNNAKAIEEWYISELPKLPKKDLNKIMDELMDYNDEEQIKPDTIIYPSDVPFPLMKNNIPVSEYFWSYLYKRFINYLSRLTASKNIKK